MSEHQFRGIYNLGYGDAVYEHAKGRKAARQMAVGLVLLTAVLAFWAGRWSVKPRVSSAYEAGFDAGVREGTTQWEEWR